jgi:carbamoyl-phosphate synthase/aspartate carbamoyltransferase/dihydroorotase
MTTIRLPAPVDPHVHLRGMNWAHKGTFASETSAALAGGYVAVLDMPNTPPATLTPEALSYKLEAIGAEAASDWGVYYGAGQTADALTYAAIQNDVCGMKIYCNATTGDLLIDDQAVREAHYAAWQAAALRQPIAVHAEGETVLEILALVNRYHVPTHFCHISTAQEIAYLYAAKEKGLPVTIGVTPHHLFLMNTDIPRLGSLGLMKPTLKTKGDQASLWDALRDGVVDVVESDHAPHTLEEKKSANPPYGVPGLETTIPLLCTAVHEGRLTLERMIDLISVNPRRIFGIHYGDDTYTTLDVDAEYTVRRDSLHNLCRWSPFEGMPVRGKVIGVWLRGQQVYDGENILSAAGSGRKVECF